MTTPESRSRELAKGFDVRVGPKETRAPRWGATLELVRRMFNAHEAAFIAFHDPALITAYADVVEAARWAHEKLNEDPDDCGCLGSTNCGCFYMELRGVKIKEEFCSLGAAISRLDALAKDRG